MNAAPPSRGHPRSVVSRARRLPDYGEFFQLLRTFPPGPGLLELRARHPGTRRMTRLWADPRRPGPIRRWLARRGPFLDAFFGVARRDGQGGGKRNLVGLPALWVDIDQPLVEVPADLPPPTAIVFSGRGHHLYWALARAVPLAAADLDQVDRLLLGLAQRLGGDPGSAEAAHLLRIPGTLNAKYEPAVTARLICIEPARRYPVEDLLYLAAPAPPTPPAPKRQESRPALAPPSDAARRAFAECPFLAWARARQAEVSEPLWYAALTNLAVLPDGGGAAWQLSCQYPGFSEREWAQKFAHAREWGRPTSCARIHTLGFADCPGCRWWGRVRAPAAIPFKRRPSGLPGGDPTGSAAGPRRASMPAAASPGTP